MSKSPILLLTTFLLAGCDGGGSEGAGSDIEAFISNARAFQDAGQYRAAMIEARNAIQKVPGEARGYMALASIYNELGQGRVAAEILEQSESQDVGYLLTLANAYVLSGKYRSAVELLASPSVHMAGSHAIRRLELLGRANAGLGNLEASRAHFEAILRDRPESAEGLLGLALIASAQGDLDEAERHVNRVLELDERNSDALVALGSLYARRDDLDKAEELLTEAISVMPSTDIMTRERSMLLVALKDLLTRQGRTGEALVYSRMLAEAFPEGELVKQRFERAMEAFGTGELDRAESLLHEINEKAPGTRSADTLLGVINFLRGNNDVAVEYFEGALDPETASPVAMQIFALAQLRLNDPDAVLDMLASEIEYSEDANLNALYGLAALNAGRREMAYKHLKRALALEPKQGRFRMLLARYHNIEGRRNEALEELRAAYRTEPRDQLVQSSLTRQLMSMDRVEEAGTLVEEIVTRYGDRPSSHLIAGAYHLGLRELDSAAASFLQATELEPDAVRGHLALAQTRLYQRHLDEAERLYRKVIELDPDQANAYKGLITLHEVKQMPQKGIDAVLELAGDLDSATPLLVMSEYYARQNRMEEAFRYLNKASAKDPLSVDYRQLALELRRVEARRALARKDYPQARKVIFDALATNHNDPELLAVLAQVELSGGNVSEAAKVVEELKRVAPNTATVNMLEGDVAVSRGSYSEAADLYKRAWELQPNDRVALKLHGVLLKGVSHEPDTVDSFLNEWERTFPDSVAMKVTRAGRYLQLGNRLAARDLYEEVIRMQPDIPIAYNNLAWSYGDQNIDKALAAARRAYELVPERGEIVDTYGWFLYRAGDVATASRILEQAVALSPNNEDIRKHLEEVRASL